MSELVRAAILGTAQLAPSDAEASGTPVDALVAQLGDVDRERALLLRAGGLALLRRGARPPLRHAAPIAAAAPETLTPASARLGDLVARLLDNREPELLVEALQQMARARLRLPETLLPRALDVRDPDLRGRLQPLLGERGRWLAGLERDWSWARAAAPDAAALPADLDARWEEGSAGERRQILARLRRVDPARARALMLAAWPKEKASERVAWLELLEASVGAEDEPLLAGLLDDRSSQVRLAAAHLLWRLPASALAQQLAARADAMLALERGGRALAVTLPSEPFEPTWERDGIVEEAPAGMGRRQWWLSQSLAAVEPAHWTTRLGLPPATLVAAAAAHELAFALLDGFTAAALRHDAGDWYAPLWDAWAASGGAPRQRPQARAELAARLTAAEAEPRMLPLLDGGSDAALLLRAFARPWPRAVAQRFVSRLAAFRPELTAVLPVAALALPLDLLPPPGPPPATPGDNPYVAQAFVRAFEQLHAIAAVRRALAQEIPS